MIEKNNRRNQINNMRKIVPYILAILLILTTINIVSCSNKQISTKEDVIKFVKEKGKDEVNWKDFEHLEHENVLFGVIGEQYKLNDGNYLLLSGTSYEIKPETIEIFDSNHKKIKTLK